MAASSNFPLAMGMGWGTSPDPVRLIKKQKIRWPAIAYWHGFQRNADGDLDGKFTPK